MRALTLIAGRVLFKRTLTLVASCCLVLVLAMATLQTHRIALRTPLPEDDAPMVALYSDPETMRHLPTLHHPRDHGAWTLQSMAARRESRALDELHGRARSFTIVLLETHAVIGQAGFRSLTPQRGEFGVIVGQGQQGRGLAWDVHLLLLTLGFESLGLEAVEWVTSKANQGMLAVLTKLGCREIVGVDEGDDDGEDAVWRSESVKYILCKEDWSECKRRLSENVDRYSAGSRTFGL